MEMQQLNLSERDFTLIVEALDYLPDKNIASEVMSNMLQSMCATSDEERKAMSHERSIREGKLKRERDVLKEEIRILQGKLLSFKRYLIEKNALNQVDEILSK